jgi:hypothetical protein
MTEIERSSSPQNPPSLSVTLGLLAASVTFIIGWITAVRSMTSSPQSRKASAAVEAQQPNETTVTGKTPLSTTCTSVALEQKEESYKRRQERRELWTLIFEILTFFVVGAYTIVAYHQWQEMTKATRATEKAATAAEQANIRAETSDKETRRAYITRANAGEVSSYDEGDGIPTVGIEIFATGETPAFSVQRVVKWEILRLPLNKSHVFPDPPYTESPFTLANPELDSVRTKVILSPEQRQQIQNGNFGVVMWGNVQYSSFGQIHHTPFCYVLANDLKHSRGKCPSHNNAD